MTELDHDDHGLIALCQTGPDRLLPDGRIVNGDAATQFTDGCIRVTHVEDDETVTETWS